MHTNADGSAISNLDTLEKPLPKLFGDKRRLLQALINLLKNALKFTSAGSIMIETFYDRQDGNLVVEIQDTGVGISAEDLPSLFKKFGKLHRTAEMNIQGIGLGLMIVK